MIEMPRHLLGGNVARCAVMFISYFHPTGILYILEFNDQVGALGGAQTGAAQLTNEKRNQRSVRINS